MNIEELLQWLTQFASFEKRLWGNSVLEWLLAIVLTVLLFLVLRITLAWVKRHVRRITSKTLSGWDDGVTQTLETTKGWFLLLVSVYLGSLVLELSGKSRDIVETVAILALLLQAALWGTKLLKFVIEHYMNQRRESDPALATTVSAMSFIGNLVLWSVVILLALDNLGVEVTALVAGLGVGGIAVALAAQNILGDLFASLSIVLDQPFVMGDFIIVGDQMGTVEKVGLKTTRVRALSGEQLVFANTDLLQSRIRNFKRMRERRVVFAIGVVYETPRTKLTEIPRIIREIVESQEGARFDRSHFKEFADFSLNFETVYYVEVPDYNVYMDVQQAINLAIFERFAAEGIDFAYPTRKLFVQQGSGEL